MDTTKSLKIIVIDVLMLFSFWMANLPWLSILNCCASFMRTLLFSFNHKKILNPVVNLYLCVLRFILAHSVGFRRIGSYVFMELICYSLIVRIEITTVIYDIKMRNMKIRKSKKLLYCDMFYKFIIVYMLIMKYTYLEN